MSDVAVQLWPFPVSPADQGTPHHADAIRLFEEAAASGFRAGRLQGVTGTDYFAESTTGRRGDIDYRGRSRWEVSLFEAGERAHSFWTDDFARTAAAVLGWLRGDSGRAVAAAVEGHVIRGAVTPEPTQQPERAAS